MYPWWVMFLSITVSRCGDEEKERQDFIVMAQEVIGRKKNWIGYVSHGL